MDVVNILSTPMVENLHFISFGLLMLAGLNLPISEDLVFIISASIAATIIPENKYLIFAGCFLGAFISDIIAYLLGRYGLTLLFKTRIFNRKSTRKRIVLIEFYFNKYGGFALFVGRFIPFGVRNMLFLTAGMVKFRLLKFILVDLSALTITSTLLFYLGYKFGENIDIVIHHLKSYKIVVFVALAIIFLVLIFKIIKSRTR
ncbi:MAG: DedA family protein [Spirochaetota bacterium]